MSREALRKFINDKCIRRVPPGSQEMPGMPNSGIPFYSWQFYLRPAILNAEWLCYISECFWDKFTERFLERPFQIAGLESASISVITSILLTAPSPVNAFAVRKERKVYGIGNIIEGIPNDLPVLFVDDLTSPKHYAFWKTVRALSEARLTLYPWAFVVVRKQSRDVDAAIATSIGTTRVESIFTLDDFDLEYGGGAGGELREEFERCWPWLRASFDHGALRTGPGEEPFPTHTKEHIWKRILGGAMFFWPGRKCALLTRFIDHPTGLKTHLWVATGGEKNAALDEIRAMIPEIEQFAIEHGCHRAMGEGREGWTRIYDGYQVVGTRKIKNLVDPRAAQHLDR